MSSAPAPMADQSGEDSDEDVDGYIHLSQAAMLRQAQEAAHDAGRIQALYFDAQLRYDNLAKESASAQKHIEETYRKLKTVEVERNSVQSKLNLAEQLIKRLQEGNAQNAETPRSNEEKETIAMNWQSRYVLCQSLLVNSKLKSEDLENKYKKAVHMVRTVHADKVCLEKQAIALEGKVALKNNEIRALKKHWNVIIRLIADISREYSDDLPPSMCVRLNKLPLDELLQVAKPSRGAGDSDDEDAETIERLLELDSGSSKSPRKAGRPRGSRGGRGGRGRVGGDFVDESIHEDVLARKLHRDDDESMAAPPSDQHMANSVMGRKTETVREQQERFKEGFKGTIEKMKKEAKDSEAKDVVDESLEDVSKRGFDTVSPGGQFLDDLLLLMGVKYPIRSDSDEEPEKKRARRDEGESSRGEAAYGDAAPVPSVECAPTAHQLDKISSSTSTPVRRSAPLPID